MSQMAAKMRREEELREEFEAEWGFIFRTLTNVASEAQLGSYRDMAWRALRRGERLVFMPHFWAVGRKLAASP